MRALFFGFYNGRGDRIRTCDFLVPNQTRYQAALHPEPLNNNICTESLSIHASRVGVIHNLVMFNLQGFQRAAVYSAGARQFLVLLKCQHGSSGGLAIITVGA